MAGLHAVSSKAPFDGAHEPVRCSVQVAMRHPWDPYAPPELAPPPDALDPADLEELRRPSKAGDTLLAIFLVLTFGSPVFLACGFGVGALARAVVPAAAIVAGPLAALACAIRLGITVFRWLRRSGRAGALKVVRVLVLCVLPVWGLLYSHFLGESSCSVSSCSADETAFRPFAEPEVVGLVAFHVLTVIAYAVSRRRPRALRPIAEALVHATLLAGAIAHAVIAVHVARWIGVGVVLAPVFLPCAAPLLTVIVYVVELRDRLRRRGAEAATAAPHFVADSPFRAGPIQEPLRAAPRVHVGMLARALALGPAILGAHAVLQALWLGRADGALRVFTRTCGHVLSQVPIEIIPQDCHYLCTVAARGHAWLVRPERLGRRRGVTIVVNRQLAIANAFEDLLHERWPRFGRLARRIYDRVGLPVSRYLRRPWLADLTYLAMKPAEWAFALALLLLDRGEPEQRIDRMYR